MSRQLLSFYISALAITGVGVLGSALIPRAHANGRDKMTVVNVNERISANNKVLDPGTYVCKLDSRAALDFLLSDSHRHLTWRPRDRRSLPTSANNFTTY
ncbi:MAG: hypothetical protein ACJ74Z_21470 [Bryobacteraceae bacterium]